jgi:hypothetical protein
MNAIKSLAVSAAVAVGFIVAAPQALAQVELGVDLGPAPDCPYGFYDFEPYDCAPYGYYGPEWFAGGIFIGVGPWFRGHPGFRGHVNHHYDPRYGYHGPFPGRGEPRHPDHHMDRMDGFNGTQMRDGRGNGFGGHEGGHEGGGHEGGRR